MSLFTFDELIAAVEIVRTVMPATPSYRWPLLSQRYGVDLVVKHENHSPTGAFKARGVPVYLDCMKRDGRLPAGVVSATRGNHGQAVALAARRHQIPSVIVVPHGNSVEKNAAITAGGAELIIDGHDFDESRAVAVHIAAERSFHLIPPFHRDIVLGVATYAYELFSQFADLDVVYAPIGMGSGVCGLIEVRDLLGLSTEIVGVVAEHAPAFARSFSAGYVVKTESTATFADGMACREPQEDAFKIIARGCSRIVRVSDEAIAEAMLALYTDTHNVAEGAGAAALAAAELEAVKGKAKVGVILSGGNIDRSAFVEVLNGRTPGVAMPGNGA